MVSINSASGEALETAEEEIDPCDPEKFPLIPLRVKH